jgi:hypothetical protein
MFHVPTILERALKHMHSGVLMQQEAVTSLQSIPMSTELAPDVGTTRGQIKVYPAVLMVPNIENSIINLSLNSKEIEVNTSAGIRYPRA